MSKFKKNEHYAHGHRQLLSTASNNNNFNLNPVFHENVNHINIASPTNENKIGSFNQNEFDEYGHRNHRGSDQINSPKKPSHFDISLFSNNEKIDKKQWSQKNDSTKSVSTLSLHITAYENAFEASDISDKDTRATLINIKKKHGNKEGESKVISFGKNLFEIPRQQDDCVDKEPELAQFRASQQLLNPNHVNEKMPSNESIAEYQSGATPNTCYFNILHEQRSEFVPARCQNKSLKTLSHFVSTTYDNTIHSEAEILLARGAGIFKMLNENYENIFICEDHEKELLTKWNAPVYKHQMTRKKDGQKKNVCSFPVGYGIDHKDHRPFACDRIVTFEKAALFMEKYHQLIHVGLHICKDHNNFLNDLLENAVLPDADYLSDHYNLPSHSSDEDYLPPQKTALSATEKETKTAVSMLAKAAGTSRVGTYGDYCTLAPDTQRKKVDSFDKMVKVVATQMAPDNPNALINDYLEKKNDEKSSSTTIDKILQDHAEWFYLANDYREKTEVLAQIARRFHFNDILQYIPDLKLSRFTAARKLALQRNERWKQPVVKTIRVRYNKEFLSLFVEFALSPYITVDLPFGRKKAKLSSGETIEFPNTLRRYHKHEIIHMFQKYTIEINRPDVILGYSTMNKALDIMKASQQITMHCVNYFIANGDEAFVSLIEIVDDLSKNCLIDESLKKDIKKLFLESKNYLKTDYRLNIKMHSPCPDHCILYALSDPTNPNFCADDCSELVENGHQHQEKCDRCSLFQKAIFKLVEKMDIILSENENDPLIQEKISDFKEMIIKHEKTIEDQKTHYLRSVYSDIVRSGIIQGLKDGEAFVTMDYIMKFIPAKNLQTQRDWYGLKGLSWHCCHIFANIGGKIVQHSVVHILGYEKQDARVVTTIVRDLLTKLKNWNIKNVSFRADNASCYHNTELLVNLFLMAGPLGITVKRFSFSEPQNGKSSADTEAARLKRIIRNWIDSGHNVETIFDLFDALQSGTIPLCALTVVVAKVIGKEFETKNTLTGISKISDVTFDYVEKQLVYWQHYMIGKGQIMKISDYINLKLNAKLEILKTTEHRPDDSNYLFWRPLHMASSEIEKSAIAAVLNENAEINDNGTNVEEVSSSIQTLILHCPVDGCRSTFIKQGWLRKHCLIGKHNFPSDKCTLNDYVLKEFATKLEGITSKFPDLLKMAQNRDGIEEISVKKGWAIRKPATRTIYTTDMKKFLDNEFKAYQEQGKRIDPKEVQKKMAEIKNRERKTRFKPTERLSAMQIGRYFVAKLNKTRGGENETEKEEDIIEVDDNVLFDEPMFQDNFEAFFDSIEDWSELIPRGKEQGEFEETIEDFENETNVSQNNSAFPSPVPLTPSTPINPLNAICLSSSSTSKKSSKGKRKASTETPSTTSNSTPKKSRK